jgi:ribosomal protein L11 methyltransferase
LLTSQEYLLSDLPAYRQCLPSKGMLLISGFYEEDLPVLREKASTINLEFKSMRTENPLDGCLFRGSIGKTTCFYEKGLFLLHYFCLLR